MKYSVECLPCLVNQTVRVVKRFISEEEEQLRLVKEVMAEMLLVDDDTTSPYIAHRIQETLARALGNPDPYKEEKVYYNQEMMKLLPNFSRLIDEAADPFAAAVKLAAAGNIIDFGPGYDLSPATVLKTIAATMEMPLPEDTLTALKEDLAQAKTLLYLGDNTGEIVFDRVFVEAIKENYPDVRIYFAARGKPVLNDITEEDAYLVKMNEFAEIINNGTSIPGTMLEYVTPAFREIFEQADVIISKGQGNFECLLGSGRENLYHLFLCKCDLFVDRLGVRKNDLIFREERADFVI